MNELYFSTNLRSLFDKQHPAFVGETAIARFIAQFSCPPNPEVEYFLKHNAVDFTKKNQSVT